MNAAYNITDRNKNPQSSFSHGKPEVKSDAVEWIIYMIVDCF